MATRTYGTRGYWRTKLVNANMAIRTGTPEQATKGLTNAKHVAAALGLEPQAEALTKLSHPSQTNTLGQAETARQIIGTVIDWINQQPDGPIGPPQPVEPDAIVNDPNFWAPTIQTLAVVGYTNYQAYGHYWRQQRLFEHVTNVATRTTPGVTVTEPAARPTISRPATMYHSGCHSASAEWLCDQAIPQIDTWVAEHLDPPEAA